MDANKRTANYLVDKVINSSPVYKNSIELTGLF